MLLHVTNLLISVLFLTLVLSFGLEISRSSRKLEVIVYQQKLF